MFKRLLAIMAISAFTLTNVSAQTKDEKAVADAVETLRKAMVSADKATLESITLDQLTYGHSSGKLEDKKTFVENITNGNSHFLDITLTDQTITVVKETAIVRHKLSANTDDKGKGPRKVELYILLVWQKNGGKWKLLARQAVKVNS
ncbi:nuclear transport factor 2 family protein [Pinibacter aurantiacus]|uniref:Nuclear transport factor 2 family protein n=1 Tax=Pinibacter aurantiacus TaxID=2851599 RepID=A0A9E2S6N8_9BACT|nr:nuclear transport factor 2 family protein [Pinibacter aurantiacus]MBV4356682.1 nuclear transport factor 2 family protein [Pinibacter aurantiacus]